MKNSIGASWFPKSLNPLKVSPVQYGKEILGWGQGICVTPFPGSKWKVIVSVVGEGCLLQLTQCVHHVLNSWILTSRSVFGRKSMFLSLLIFKFYRARDSKHQVNVCSSSSLDHSCLCSVDIRCLARFPINRVIFLFRKPSLILSPTKLLL